MNNDLISRSALLSKTRTIKPPECNSCEYEHMEYVRAEDVRNAPAVDAEVVRHGRWVHLGGDEWCCPVCGEVIHTEGSWEKPTCNYCPNCGAKMDAEVEK